jgi:hypothetical protein
MQLSSSTFHEFRIIDLRYKIRMMLPLFLHNYPKRPIQHQILHPWLHPNQRRRPHQHKRLILNLRPNLIHPKLNLLNHLQNRIVLQRSALHCRANHLSVFPLDVELDNWHLEFIEACHAALLTGSRYHRNNILGLSILTPLNNK